MTTAPIYFASGASATADIRGFARIGHPIGVSIPVLHEPGIIELESLAGKGVPVFCDTGAFSEVELDATGLHVVDPIDESGWQYRIDVQHRLAVALGTSLYAMAPDRVGDQEHTLRLLRRWATDVRTIRSLGARIVVAIQRGPLPQAVFDRAVAEALCFNDFVRGIPSNKDAMPTHELEAYLRDVRPQAVHMLGIGPKRPRCIELMDVLQRFVPAAVVSCDSNAINANVGRDNGRHGESRRLTATQSGRGVRHLFLDEVKTVPLSREDAIVMTFGPELFFRRMEAMLNAGGVYLSGFQRLGDGLMARGFEPSSPTPRQVQGGLFDAVDSTKEQRPPFGSLATLPPKQQGRLV